MIVADTAFFIALFRESDEMHERAHELQRELEEKRVMLLVTTHVIDETVTYLLARNGNEAAYKVANFFLTAENISIEIVGKREVAVAAEILRKYGRLSMCDSLNVEAARRHGLTQILSFDSGFDHVEKITRIH